MLQKFIYGLWILFLSISFMAFCSVKSLASFEAGLFLMFVIHYGVPLVIFTIIFYLGRASK